MRYIALLLSVLLFSQCQKATNSNYIVGNVQPSVPASGTAQNPMFPNKPPEIEISGEYAKAFLVAYDAFKQDPQIPEQKKQIEKYHLQFRRDSQAYFVFFVSVPFPHVGGGTESGRDVTYAVSKKDYQITSRQFYK